MDRGNLKSSINLDGTKGQVFTSTFPPIFPSLSGQCGYCLSNNIRCNANAKPACLTCRVWGVECPLIDRSYGDSSGEGLTAWNCDGSSPPSSELVQQPPSSAPVHYMQPLDNLISTIHDLLLGTLTPYTYTSTLPPYIKKPHHEIPLEDVQYRHENGVFTFPDAELRNELLKTFVLNVYP